MDSAGVPRLRDAMPLMLEFHTWVTLHMLKVSRNSHVIMGSGLVNDRHTKKLILYDV